MAIKRKKKKTYFLQVRLHEDVEDELHLIELCENLSAGNDKRGKFTDREIGRMALRELDYQMSNNDLKPQARITPAIVDAQMLRLLEHVEIALASFTELSENLNNGSWSKEQTVNHVNNAMAKLGVPLNAARHVSSIYQLDEKDEWE